MEKHIRLIHNRLQSFNLLYKEQYKSLRIVKNIKYIFINKSSNKTFMQVLAPHLSKANVFTCTGRCSRYICQGKCVYLHWKVLAPYLPKANVFISTGRCSRTHLPRANVFTSTGRCSCTDFSKANVLYIYKKIIKIIKIMSYCDNLLQCLQIIVINLVNIYIFYCFCEGCRYVLAD